jgi:hypothetical protein
MEFPLELIPQHVMLREFAGNDNIKSYVPGRVVTGRVPAAGDTEMEVPDKEGLRDRRVISVS